MYYLSLDMLRTGGAQKGRIFFGQNPSICSPIYNLFPKSIEGNKELPGTRIDVLREASQMDLMKYLQELGYVGCWNKRNTEY